jgi:hypothetical protein
MIHDQATALRAAGYFLKHRGVCHAELTKPAYEILMIDLGSRGNRPGELQKEALMELLGVMTQYAQGVASGRRAINLATGCGKTSAIIAWIAALDRLKLQHIGVSVAAGQVEALCSIKRALLEHGVPEKKIGLKHSLGAAASLPSTGDSERQFMLVSHARVKGGTDNALFTEYRGKPRALMLFDETLFKAETIAVSDLAIRKAAASYREQVRGRTACAGLLDFLATAVDMIANSLDGLRSGAEGAQKTILLPTLSQVELDGYTALIGHAAEYEPLRELLTLSPYELRVMATQQHDGIIWYSLSVPHNLSNVLILDASYPVRKLAQLDSTIICDSKYANKEVKRFDNVTIHQMLTYGGRHSITESFRQQHKSKREISREVVEVVKSIPDDQGILIFTFKARPGDKVIISEILKRDLHDAGIDSAALLVCGKPRIAFLTYGSETSLNDYAHCQTVIMAGVLHRSYLDLASAIVGQQDDLQSTVDNSLIREMLDSEIAHVVYQGLSRGASRVVIDGQASPMQLFLIHRDLGIRKSLARVMPGVSWKVWKPQFMKADTIGTTALIALKVSEFLAGLDAKRSRISTRQLKVELGVTAASRTFSDALSLLGSTAADWRLDGRSLVRADAAYHGFKAEHC